VKYQFAARFDLSDAAMQEIAIQWTDSINECLDYLDFIWFWFLWSGTRGWNLKNEIRLSL